MPRKKAQQVLDERPSEPLLSALHGSADLDYNSAMMLVFQRVHEESPGPGGGRSVDWLRSKLGPASFTYDGSRRYRVWERESYRVFAAPGYGLSVEFFPARPRRTSSTRSAQLALAAARAFLTDVGVWDDLRDPDVDVMRMPESVAKDLALRLRRAIRSHRAASVRREPSSADYDLWAALDDKGVPAPGRPDPM